MLSMVRLRSEVAPEYRAATRRTIAAGAHVRASRAMPARHLLQVVPPVHVARRAEAVDKDHGRAVAALHVMHPKRADVDESRTHRRRPSGGLDHWLGSIRAGVASPVIFKPVVNRRVSVPWMTVTAPGPAARQAPSVHIAALRSSMPSSVTPGSSRWADSTQRLPKVSKCGSTAVSGTTPRAPAGRRLNRFGQLARIRVWPQSAIAPADDPASEAPARQASKIAAHTRDSRSTCATRPGSPPAR